MVAGSARILRIGAAGQAAATLAVAAAEQWSAGWPGALAPTVWGTLTLSLLPVGLVAGAATRVAGPADDGHVARVLALRRRSLPLAAGIAAISALLASPRVLALVPAEGPPGAILPSLALPAGQVALTGLLAAIVLSQVTRPDRAIARAASAARAARQRASAAASRASAVIPAQSPLTIFPFGATQLPPTQSVFGSDR